MIAKLQRPFIDRVPTYDELNWPALKSIENLGGSASISEHLTSLIDMFDVNDSVAEKPHGKTGRTELEYRLAWARTALKRCGFLENSARGIWSLTEAGEQATTDDLIAKISELRAIDTNNFQKRKPQQPKREQQLIHDGIALPDTDLDWRDRLLEVLKAMDPSAFERLGQRLLRESGFVKVEVTGKTGDGGIDGTGILQISLMSFHVLFQCKRYNGSVGSPAVRDFRGAMVGRTDKGLFITTGTFSPDARREATRDGAPPIDLIDGVAVCEKLKELALGVETKLVEEITIKPTWFEQL